MAAIHDSPTPNLTISFRGCLLQPKPPQSGVRFGQPPYKGGCFGDQPTKKGPFGSGGKQPPQGVFVLGCKTPPGNIDRLGCVCRRFETAGYSRVGHGFGLRLVCLITPKGVCLLVRVEFGLRKQPSVSGWLLGQPRTAEG
ncbi:hypothetical protein Tco_1574821, partial [Tanacetum coccineum]